MSISHSKLKERIDQYQQKSSDEWMGVVFYLGIVFRSGMGCHLLTKVVQKRYMADGAMVEDKSIIDLFKDRPPIDNFGYMLECLSTYDAYNKKTG